MTLQEVIKDLRDRGYHVDVHDYCPNRVWSTKGYEDSYSWCDGNSAEGTIYYVLTKDGKLLEVPYDSSGSTGSGEQWNNDYGMTVAEFLKEEGINYQDVAYIIEKEFNYCTWERRPDERYLASIYPVQPLDIKKIRRRIEDRLRKSCNSDIIATAVFLGVKLS